MRSLYASAVVIAVLTATGCSWNERITKLEQQQEALLKEQSDISKEQADLNKKLSATDVRVDTLEDQLKELRDETRGVGTRNVSLVPTHSMVALFGNQSGYNAAVTVSNTGPSGKSTDSLSVRTSRIPRPSDRVARRTDNLPTDLPADAVATEKLDLSQVGASRQLIVPCGFQLEGQSSYHVRLNIRVKYDTSSCVTE